MPFDTKIMKDFIQSHKSQYTGKYRFHSSYRKGDYVFKNRFYIYEENFRQVDIFVEIDCKDTITYQFSEELHELEKIYIVKEALKRIIERYEHKNTLHYSIYENVVKNGFDTQPFLEPYDYIDIYNYMKYLKGINQKTVDLFYKSFIPVIKDLIEKQYYKKAIDSIICLLNNILYQREWKGVTNKYLDTEYQYHLYYFRELIRIVCGSLKQFNEIAHTELISVIKKLCTSGRFTFAIMTDFGNLVLSDYAICATIIEELSSVFKTHEEDDGEESLVYMYMYAIFYSDYELYKSVILKLHRHIIKHILAFANSDLDQALGQAFIQSDGYELLLELFSQDFNSYIFNCYPIDSFPEHLQYRIKDELIGAIRFFGARMQNENYRQSSFELVHNINRLLMNNFKEWYK